MTGKTITFDNSGKTERVRKTIPFDPINDALILDYINSRVEAGENFTSVVKELLLQMITLIQLGPTYCQTTPMTGHNKRMTEENGDFSADFDDPFASLLK